MPKENKENKIEEWIKEFEEKFYKWEFFEVLKPKLKEELKGFIATQIKKEREKWQEERKKFQEERKAFLSIIRKDGETITKLVKEKLK